MNKQELIALLNEKFKDQKYPSWPEYDIAHAVNAALKAYAEEYEEFRDKAVSGEHDRYSYNTIYLEFKGYRVATIIAHKKRGKSHSRYFGDFYYDWTFKEFKDEDVTIINGNTLEEAIANAAQSSVMAKQDKDAKLRYAREVVDHLMAEYGLDEHDAYELCDYIKSNRYALSSLKAKDKKIV